MNRLSMKVVCLSALVMGVAGRATAGPVYTFFQITNNGNTNVGGQLKMEVNAGGPGVLFTFTNEVGTASSITDIYFDDGSLLAGPSVESQSAGVLFSSPASPGNLPGGGAVGFVTSQAFSADSNAPVSANGVNAAIEWLTLGFTLQGTQTVDDVISELAAGTLRVGLHVQAIGTTGGSESYVNVVPLPGAAWAGLSLLGSMGGVGFFRSRRRSAELD